ncbi:hypothetical protein I5729_01380 [Acinetobacter bereziniae]|uniref:surface-adhesin E family protein n=1 Tax=Acinetobacter bereziniae TaxID=106648 RepID=UPI0019027EFB|nr:surface-adhesin E family protein [Acinetobacter bereziniae]MBJ9947767.1 hypothetical protein [Acinetobacter bereziniae]
MNKIFLLSFLLFFSGCSSIDVYQKSESSDWIKLDKMSPAYDFSISKNSFQVISHSPKIIKVTSKMENTSRINTMLLDKGNYLLGTDEIDCDQKMTKTITAATYNNDGTLLVKQDMTNSIFKKVTPDSTGEEILKIACKL